MGGLLVLLLFGVFAVCILSVLLTGAGNYRKLLERDRDSYEHRTAMQYLVTKIHESDQDGAVYVGDFETKQPAEEGDTLFLSERFDSGEYITRIYTADGMICELFTAADGEFNKADGEKILSADTLSFEKKEGCITIHLTDENGEKNTLTLSLRSGKAVK